MFLANINFYCRTKKKKNKNKIRIGNSELKLKIPFKVFLKPFSKIYAEFSIAESKKKKKKKKKQR